LLERSLLGLTVGLLGLLGSAARALVAGEIAALDRTFGADDLIFDRRQLLGLESGGILDGLGRKPRALLVQLTKAVLRVLGDRGELIGLDRLRLTRGGRFGCLEVTAGAGQVALGRGRVVVVPVRRDHQLDRTGVAGAFAASLPVECDRRRSRLRFGRRRHDSLLVGRRGRCHIVTSCFECEALLRRGPSLPTVTVGPSLSSSAANLTVSSRISSSWLMSYSFAVSSAAARGAEPSFRCAR
jgi:hypothetical protein